jgi:hypothetical protein
MVFKTSSCARYGHAEFSFVLAERIPVPGLERMLLGYFEGHVARGVRFGPAQNIDLGGSILRLFDRGDGTLGVRDVGPDGNVVEPDSAHRSLMRTWLRQEVARSYGLSPEFPAPSARALVCTATGDSRHALMLKRMNPSDARDSGWYVGCTDPRHDHDNPANLLSTVVGTIPLHFPWLDQFLALPVGTELVVEMGARVSVPVLWRPDRADPVDAIPGSYVASLNSAARP